MIVHVGMKATTVFSLALDTKDKNFAEELERLLSLDANGWAHEMAMMGRGMDMLEDYTWESGMPVLYSESSKSAD